MSVFYGILNRFRDRFWMEVSLLTENKVAEAKRKSRNDSWCIHTM